MVENDKFCNVESSRRWRAICHGPYARQAVMVRFSCISQGTSRIQNPGKASKARTILVLYNCRTNTHARCVLGRQSTHDTQKIGARGCLGCKTATAQGQRTEIGDEMSQMFAMDVLQGYSKGISVHIPKYYFYMALACSLVKRSFAR
nr:hypothetical protein CFP56_04174 [Quercus suber]